MSIKFGDRHLRVMGILNVTPDSFSDGGQYVTADEAVKHAGEMVRNGADIIDVGGESTRPGSKPITAGEELSRILPVIEKIRDFTPLISVDTTKYEVAEQALKLGAGMINDISGLHYDQGLADLAAERDAFLVIMHMRGRPETMQNNPVYSSLVDDIKNYFKDAVRTALSAGVRKEKIILDPGIGFGKTTEDNLEIIRRLKEFKETGYSVLLGASRKSVINAVSKSNVNNRLGGSIAIACAAAHMAADILRVHDVYESTQALKVYSRLW